jgi:hypothetical protein
LGGCTGAVVAEVLDILSFLVLSHKQLGQTAETLLPSGFLKFYHPSHLVMGSSFLQSHDVCFLRSVSMVCALSLSELCGLSLPGGLKGGCVKLMSESAEVHSVCT